MATQCKEPFELILYSYRQGVKHQQNIELTSSLEALLESVDRYTLNVTENATYELFFDAKDPEARLYIEGLDSVEGSIYHEQYEQYYCLPSQTPFVWFCWTLNQKALIPGRYYIKVLCHKTWYYGALEVDPRRMKAYELRQMREEVEAFMLEWKELPSGIKESIQTMSTHQEGNNQKVQIQMLMAWYEKLVPLLNDFKRNPYGQIEKVYRTGTKELSKKSDQTSLKKTLKKAQPHQVYSYTKHITYDTQENKWVKSLIQRLLKLVIKLQLLDLEKEERESLKKIEVLCQSLGQCYWYQDLQCQLHEKLPIRSLYDSRYRTLDQFDNALWQSIKSVGLKRAKAALWLETSWVYELWCFQKVYHLLTTEMGYKQQSKSYHGYVLSLKGTTLKLYYDAVIPTQTSQTNKETCPLYALSPRHCRPDGRIDIYKDETYCGSIILEFKYSSYYNVWNEQRETRCSEQLLYYGYLLASPYLENRYHLPPAVFKQLSPMQNVLVIMPKLKGESLLEVDQESNIVQVKLLPNSDTSVLQAYLEEKLS